MTTPFVSREHYIAMWLLENEGTIDGVPSDISDEMANNGRPLAWVGEFGKQCDVYRAELAARLDQCTELEQCTELDQCTREFAAWLDQGLDLLSTQEYGNLKDTLAWYRGIAAKVADPQTKDAVLAALSGAEARLETAVAGAAATRAVAKLLRGAEYGALAEVRKYAEDVGGWRAALGEFMASGQLTKEIAVDFLDHFDRLEDADYRSVKAQLATLRKLVDQVGDDQLRTGLSGQVQAGTQRLKIAREAAYAAWLELSRELRPALLDGTTDSGTADEGEYEKLRMQTDTGTAQHLDQSYDGFETGAMGDCVSVVVLWARNGFGIYKQMRGYHGDGGFRSVNLDSLLAGVPDDDGTLVLALMGSVARASNDEQRLRDAFREQLGGAVLDVQMGAGRVNRKGEFLG